MYINGYRTRMVDTTAVNERQRGKESERGQSRQEKLPKKPSHEVRTFNASRGLFLIESAREADTDNVFEHASTLRTASFVSFGTSMFPES